MVGVAGSNFLQVELKMGCWYSVEGSMRVQDTEEARALIGQLQDYVEEGFDVSAARCPESKTFIVALGGYFECSHTTAALIEQKLEQFGPHVVGASIFTTNTDLVPGEVWIGLPADVKKLKDERAMQKVREALMALTKQQRFLICWEQVKQIVVESCELKSES